MVMALVWMLGLAAFAMGAGGQQRYGLACAAKVPEVDWLRPAVTRCFSQPNHEGAIPIAWTLDEERVPPAPGSRSIAIAVQEEYCASGRNPIPYLDKPEVAYLKRSVVINVWVHPPEGFSTCQSNPVGHLRVKLPGPLGNRTLFDGASDPPRRVKPGEDPRRPSR